MSISFAIAIPLGVLMARYWVAERIFNPVLSVLLPIPSLAWVPLFILWFGIGDRATIVVVIYASSFPMIYAVWTGVRAVNPIWLRAAIVMGADEMTLFRKVIWPGTLPYIITGLAGCRSAAPGSASSAASCWRARSWGWARSSSTPRNSSIPAIMLSTLIAIGVIGVFFERFVFQRLEAMTVRRWGMVSGPST